MAGAGIPSPLLFPRSWGSASRQPGPAAQAETPEVCRNTGLFMALIPVLGAGSRYCESLCLPYPHSWAYSSTWKIVWRESELEGRRRGNVVCQQDHSLKWVHIALAQPPK